jgi:hypothetical protein
LSPKKIHRVLGLVLVLPLLGWAVTGAVFLIKPGYSGAYEQLTVKLYPIEIPFSIVPREGWVETRIVRTILGYHLLVNTGSRWEHLDPATVNVKSAPDELDLIKLLEDSVHSDKARYGRIEKFENDKFHTSTGVELTLNWDTLRISQKGKDTKLIDTLYKIHYLQWLGQKQANTIFGIFGLLSLLVLVYFGIVLYLRGRKNFLC